MLAGVDAPGTTYVPTWVDLLDLVPGHRVLLTDEVAGDRDVARAVLGRGAVVVDVDDAAPADVVCVRGARSRAQLRRLAAVVAPGARLALVVDNALSPLRLADSIRRRHRGAASAASARGPARLRGDLAAAGLEVEQHFGLLRSSTAPSTAFDLTAAGSVQVVLEATLSHVGGVRGVLARRLAEASPDTVARACPAWLLLARSPGGGAPEPDGRIVGKISNRDSEEVKLVRGAPPRVLEKHYLTAGARPEHEALRELEQAGFGLAPRLVGEPGLRGSRVTWLSGRPMLPHGLDDDALLAWTARAGRVLDDLQARTRQDDGSVLVHGDYWLGNLLVEDDRVVGVVDWTGAHRGDRAVDRAFLLDSTARLRPGDPALRARLERAVGG